MLMIKNTMSITNNKKGRELKCGPITYSETIGQEWCKPNFCISEDYYFIKTLKDWLVLCKVEKVHTEGEFPKIVTTPIKIDELEEVEL